MNTDNNQATGYDEGMCSGKSMCHRTLTVQNDARLSSIVKDLSQLINEAGTGTSDPLKNTRLAGYVEALATAVSLAEACGITFSTTQHQDGTEGLAARIDFKTPRALNALSSKRN